MSSAELEPPLGEQGRCFGDCQVGWVAHGDEYLDRVTVTVKLFAGLRERAGWSSREVDGVGRVGDVWAALDLGEEPPGLLYAVNKAYAEPGLALADGDEVALIPPVSGGDFRLSEEPLDLDACVAEVESEQAGRDRDVRRHDADRLARPHRPPPRVRGLSGHGGSSVMAEIADELRGRHDLIGVAIHHRVGVVGIGEPSVVIAVSSAHRADALVACHEAIDALKERVPLWKKEVYEGGEEWIGTGS